MPRQFRITAPQNCAMPDPGADGWYMSARDTDTRATIVGPLYAGMYAPGFTAYQRIVREIIASLRTMDLGCEIVLPCGCTDECMRDHCNSCRPWICHESTCAECSQCEDHCGCIHCNRCGDRVASTCEHCERGQECGCCQCSRCSRCNSAEYEICTVCDRCEDCGCRCTNTNPGRPLVDKRAPRLVGVEIEYNRTDDTGGMRTMLRTGGHGHHEDGSCGYEIVTRPLSGKYIAPALHSIADAMADAECDGRCGVHVHVDASDISWHDMYRLLRVYALVEPLLYVIGGQHRAYPVEVGGSDEANYYCRPCGADYALALTASDRKAAVLAVAYPNGGGNARDLVREYKPGKKGYSGGRYRGLNISPWLWGRRLDRYAKHAAPAKKADTTVEFRLHRNTLDGARLAGWATLCRDIVEWVATHTDKDADNLPTNNAKALAIIAPGSVPFILKRVRGWRNATSKVRGNGKPPRRIHYTAKKGYVL